MSNNLLSITEAVQKLEANEISSLDLVRACKAAVDEKNSTLNAYLEVFEDIEEQAKAADERRANGERGALLGVPLALKDNILVNGRRASAASKILENYVATYDSTVVKKLKEAGAIFMGRTNMDEFAMGGSTENSAFGVTRNPHDPTRVPGGSSGGSAAALASGMALGAFGTDTGGSIREPASFCGLVGLKPTYGAVSRFGIIALGSSLDQVGPFARSVADAELLFKVIRGQDPLDSTSITETTHPKVQETRRIGVPRALLKEGVDADVLARFEESLKKLEHLGYTIVDVEIPSAALALAIYYIIMPAEASTNLARFDGVRYGLSHKGENLFDDYAKTRGSGFGPEPRRRIMLGTYVLSAGYYDAYYGKATAARAQLTREMVAALSGCDAVVTPTAPCPATVIGEKSDPLSMYLMDIFTVTANLTGNPALSVPMGTVMREGTQLPVGIQFTAAHGNEAGLFAIGKTFEAA
ncbi:MAG: aspartyl-tRNA(Asn)/glutamyl-tRNA(Gln) amidotransferase subunit [Patescibacteria group bacterium]|nr:aspartyl-tRNA(Asn)/glutamyl-tRNA(Gln) amidotransferase subunit [Patescibacteria group bacterium]